MKNFVFKYFFYFISLLLAKPRENNKCTPKTKIMFKKVLRTSGVLIKFIYHFLYCY